MRIKSLNHIGLHVEDLEKSIDFYENVLELEKIPRPAFDFPGAWFSLGGEDELHLIAGREKSVNAASRGNHFALAVPSIKDAEAFLKQKNIPYRAPKQRPDGIWQIFLQDPDGYFIELTELTVL